MIIPVDTVIAALSALGTLIQAAGQSKVAFWDSRSKSSVAESVTHLKTELDNLDDMKTEFENDVGFRSFMDWSRNVRRAQSKMSDLLAHHSSSSRSKLKKACMKMHEEVVHLLKEGNEIKEIIYQPPEPYRARDITKFPTLQGPFDDILGWLDSDTVNGIRIYGAVGIGKTNIMLNLINYPEVVPKFHPVIWLTVSKDGKKENLSRSYLLLALVQKLRLQVGDTSNLREVEKKVTAALEGKKYLLLLDDVKEDIELQDIGIPGGNSGSKVVITTRYRHVCSSLVNQSVKVTSLNNSEAREMFRDVVGNQELISNSKIQGLAWRVCKECYGVPLYIDKVASAFKFKNNEYLWIDGLNSWRKWPEKDSKGIREVYRTLKFCYDDLDDDQKKRCFLYAVLYPESWVIRTDHLLECWEAEKFLGKREDALSHGNRVLLDLKNVSLLEEGKIENHVMMHSFIRQMALHIVESSHPCMYLVKTSSQLRDPLAAESWTKKNGISFGESDFNQLPKSPVSPALSTLFLNKNKVLVKVPSSFFTHMPKLCVLDLSDTGIDSLPPSTARLISLRNLYLNECKHLQNLPSEICKLHQLESLDIRGTGFSDMPPVVAKLTSLRRLRVSFDASGAGNAVQQATFCYSQLGELEELVLEMKFLAQRSTKEAENIIREVASLQKFRTLRFCIGNMVLDVIEVVSELRLHISEDEAIILQSFIEKQLRKRGAMLTFRILIGCENAADSKLPAHLYTERFIKYRNGKESTFPAANALAVADSFELIGHTDIKQLSDFGTMKCVKYCVVENCNVLETIVGSATDVVLPVLEDLYVKQLPKLASIFTGQLQCGSLAKLQTLVFTDCADLKLIFALGTTKQLGSIQHLEIESCTGIAEVIAESEAVGNQKLLPKLKKLILRDVPALTTICKVDSLEWASLEELEISECTLLSDFPFNTNNAKKLKVIKGDQGCRDAINKLTNQQVKDRLLKVAVAGP